MDRIKAARETAASVKVPLNVEESATVGSDDELDEEYDVKRDSNKKQKSKDAEMWKKPW